MNNTSQYFSKSMEVGVEYNSIEGCKIFEYGKSLYMSKKKKNEHEIQDKQKQTPRTVNQLQTIRQIESFNWQKNRYMYSQLSNQNMSK